MSRTLHIFRRDLRVEDNTALLEAAENDEAVLPVFIFDPRQVDTNEYRSDAAVQFMIESLEDLDRQLREHEAKLHVYHGDPADTVPELVEKHGVDTVRVNADYTPFSKERDAEIEKRVEEAGAAFKSSHDVFLTEPGSVLTGSETTYKVFTPFKNKAESTQTPREPDSNTPTFLTQKTEDPKKIYEEVLRERSQWKMRGGRKHALTILQDIADYKDYGEEREYPEKDATTHLSPYLKFGCVSAREVYWAIRKEFSAEHDLITELYWRDFYGHLLNTYPRLLQENMRTKYDDVEWDENKEALQRWKEGRTGVPIVDAAMRQLNQTGWMHNRLRMIVACYLNKDLHIHWKKGEKYFAQKLIDYDPASNNGGWQWAASTGADSQPYFRVFNPWRQQERYDADCEFIHEYVEELRGVDPDVIHSLEGGDGLPEHGYPAPLVNHKDEAEEAKRRFKAVRD